MGLIRRAVFLAALLGWAPAWAANNTADHALIIDTPHNAERFIVAGTIRPELQRAHDTGKLADNVALEHVLLVLQRAPADEKSVQDYIASLHNPASPNYHHWMTASDYGARFGSARADIEKITAWLNAQGIRVNEILPGRMMLDISGTAGTLGHAFGTEIHAVTVDGQAHMANISNISIPASLAPALAGPLSLNDFRPHRQHHRPSPRLATSGGGELVTPGDLAVIYNFTAAFKAGYTGTGQTVAVVEDTDLYSNADWSTFRSVFGLKAAYPSGTLTVQHPSCSDPGVNSDGDDVEATLDAEWASAAAPNATILLASCKETSTTDGVSLAITKLVAEKSPPKIISVSYGQCETQNTPPGNQFYATLYQQAVAEGITVFVASGDNGASDCAGNTNGTGFGIGVSGWASTVYNVAVGGTDFADVPLGVQKTYWGTKNTNNVSALSYIPEAAWNDTCAGTLLAAYNGVKIPYGSAGFCNVAAGRAYHELGGGEGGPSGCATGTAPASGIVGGSCKGWPKPSWQAGVTGIQADKVRDIPDVSMYASDGTAWNRQYALCFSDTKNQGVACTGTTPAAIANWAPGGGGTSYAAPIMAGLQALVNQKTKSAWGNANTVFYQLAAKEYGTLASGNTNCSASNGKSIGASCIFNDVKLGDNDQDCTAGSANCYAPSGKLGVLSTSTTAYKPAYLTTAGWDFPTGLGSVNAYNLITNWP